MKRILGLILAILISVPAFGAVSKTDSGTPNITSVGTVTSLDLTTLTVTAGSTCLIAVLGTNATITNSSMTWDAAGTPQAMTTVTSALNTRRIEIWYLLNPTAGNLTLRAAWTTARNAVIGAIAFTGTDPIDCVITADNVNPTGTSAAPSTGAITSTADGATVGATTTNAAAGTLAATTQTDVFEDNTATNARTGLTYALGGVSNTHSWSANSSTWVTVGIHIKAATSCSTRMLLTGVGC